MLNPFPIQFLAPLAYAMLRFFVGILLLYLGFSHIHHRHQLKYSLSLKHFSHGLFAAWYLAVFELLAGLMFVAGFYTQYAAIIGMLLSLKMLILYRKSPSPYLPSRFFYVLLFGVSLSLFITGAGAFAFDLPI